MEVSPHIFDNLEEYREIYTKQGFIQIDNWLSDTTITALTEYVKEMPLNWWKSVVSSPGAEGYQDLTYYKHFMGNKDALLKSAEYEVRALAVDQAKQAWLNNNYSYYFDRTITGEHYTECTCYGCKFIPFMESTHIKALLKDITGKALANFNEVWFAKYGAGQWLGPHHDGKKGQLTAIAYLTPDWRPHWGGLLVVLKKDWETIRTVISPKYNSLVLCGMVNEDYPHFVSHIPSHIKAHRFSFQAFYN